MFLKYRRIGAVASAAFCVASLVIVVLLGGAGWLIWVSAGVALVLLALLLVRALPARRGAVAFAAAGISGAVFSSAAGLGLPSSLPIWIWIVVALAMATIGLAEDADTTQATPRSRL